MSVRLGSAKEGDRVRALDGIDRDPSWHEFPPDCRPIPGEAYVVASAGICQRPGCDCGNTKLTYFLEDLPIPVAHYGDSMVGMALKDEWFTTEGARLQ